jgi:oligogalacturonide lyase
MKLTRRAILAAAAAPALRAVSEKGASFPSEWRRYPDPATEFEVVRLTDPANTSCLPEYYNRAISKRGSFLLFYGDRAGSRQAYRMDLKSGETRQLTAAAALDGETLALAPDERSFLCFDGPTLRRVDLGSLRDREIYEVPAGSKQTPGLTITVDGVSAVFTETGEAGSRVRLIALARNAVSTVVETPFEASHAQPRPRRAQILYRQGNEALWLVNLDGAQNRKLKTAPDGSIGAAMWAPNGRTILYLFIPDDRSKLIAIHEHTPDENLDKPIAPTSQFASFGMNSDASVFVGASRNLASPHVLLLLRVTRRELTLCEHRSSEPPSVAPVFSHDSQGVFFQSDRHGKPALYRVQVERFVEKTEDDQ